MTMVETTTVAGDFRIYADIGDGAVLGALPVAERDVGGHDVVFRSPMPGSRTAATNICVIKPICSYSAAGTSWSPSKGVHRRIIGSRAPG